MSRTDLVKETERLRREAKRKQAEGNLHEIDVLEQQYYFAKSYLMNPEDIEVGAAYHIHGESGSFRVSYLNGVMAWGKVNNESSERAIPIGRLYQPE